MTGSIFGHGPILTGKVRGIAAELDLHVGEGAEVLGQPLCLPALPCPAPGGPKEPEGHTIGGFSEDGSDVALSVVQNGLPLGSHNHSVSGHSCLPHYTQVSPRARLCGDAHPDCAADPHRGHRVDRHPGFRFPLLGRRMCDAIIEASCKCWRQRGFTARYSVIGTPRGCY